MYMYRTRIKEHLFTVNAHLEGKGDEPLTLKAVGERAHVPYNTVLRYANDAQGNPNYAVVDRIRRTLNELLPKAKQFGDAGYIYEDESLGQPVAVA